MIENVIATSKSVAKSYFNATGDLIAADGERKAVSDRTGQALLCPGCKWPLVETGETERYRYCKCIKCGISGTWLK